MRERKIFSILCITFFFFKLCAILFHSLTTIFLDWKTISIIPMFCSLFSFSFSYQTKRKAQWVHKVRKKFMELLLPFQEPRNWQEFGRIATSSGQNCKKWVLRFWGMMILLLCLLCFTTQRKSLPSRESASSRMWALAPTLMCFRIRALLLTLLNVWLVILITKWFLYRLLL